MGGPGSGIRSRKSGKGGKGDGDPGSITVMLMVSLIVSSSSFSLSIIHCIVFTIDSFTEFLMSRKFSGIEKSRWHFEFWGLVFVSEVSS